MTIKEEFEKAYWKEYGFMPENECYWAAGWMAERCAVGVGYKYCSNPNRPQENMIGSDIMYEIRQLAKELEGRG